MTPKKKTIELRLAARIREIERRYARSNAVSAGFTGEEQSDFIATGWPAVDAALGGGLVRGALHEWCGLVEPSTTQNTSRIRTPQKTKGDAIETALRVRRESWAPPICLLVHLARQALRTGKGPLWAVWVGKRCFPYPGVLGREDDGGGLLERSIFVAPRDAASRLWAIDLALRSPAVGVVVADGSNFDMAATRRVQLVAKANGTCVLLVRPPWELNELSAAQSRWLVRREPSGGFYECVERGGILVPNDSRRLKPAARESRCSRGLKPAAQVFCDVDGWCENPFSYPHRVFGEIAPGDVVFAQPANPRWSVQLLRCKGVQPERAHGVWALEWNRATRTVGLSAPMVDRSSDPQEAAASSHDKGRRSHRSA